MWSILLAVIAVAVAVYYYATQNHDYFRKHGIPHLPPKPLFGNLGSVVIKKASLTEVVRKVYDIHPDAKYAGFFEFRKPIVILRDLDLIKSVTTKHFDHFQDHNPFATKDVEPLFGDNLFLMVGERWKVHRTILTPQFTSSKIKTVFKLMSACAVRFTDQLVKLPEEERDTSMKNLLCRYTNDVIANCVYGVILDSMQDPENEFYVNGQKATSLDGIGKALTMIVQRNFPRIAKLFKVRLIAKPLSDFFTQLVRDEVRQREENGIHRPDLLQMLIDVKNNKVSGKHLTVDNIASHAFGFFFGGFDTVATQFCFMIHLLAAHPEIQARLQREIDEALENCNGELPYEAVNEMKYLDAVINETMRMYPISVSLDRLCVKDYELPPALPGGKPFTVPKGTAIWIPVTAIHRNPEYYQHPEIFDPDRFLEDGKRILNSPFYLPFGMGPRMCIGNRFAMTEMKILLCYLLARCDVKPGSKTVLPLQFQKGFALSVSSVDKFWLKVDPRRNPHPSFLNANANEEANGACNS